MDHIPSLRYYSHTPSHYSLPFQQTLSGSCSYWLHCCLDSSVFITVGCGWAVFTRALSQGKLPVAPAQWDPVTASTFSRGGTPLSPPQCMIQSDGLPQSCCFEFMDAHHIQNQLSTAPLSMPCVSHSTMFPHFAGMRHTGSWVLSAEREFTLCTRLLGDSITYRLLNTETALIESESNTMSINFILCLYRKHQ